MSAVTPMWPAPQLPPVRKPAEVDTLEGKAGREEKPGWDCNIPSASMRRRAVPLGRGLLRSLPNPKCSKNGRTQTQPPLETTCAGKEKACIPDLRFDFCLINNNRVCWNCVSYVISGKKDLCFLGISSVNPQGACCQRKQGSRCVQQGTCASTVTCAQAYAFLSPVET